MVLGRAMFLEGNCSVRIYILPFEIRTRNRKWNICKFNFCNLFAEPHMGQASSQQGGLAFFIKRLLLWLHCKALLKLKIVQKKMFIVDLDTYFKLYIFWFALNILKVAFFYWHIIFRTKFNQIPTFYLVNLDFFPNNVI